jgi:hypothetical protein
MYGGQRPMNYRQPRVRLTQIACYAILFAHQNRAASSMAEQAPLKRKVQGSTPWQPTSV